MMLFPCSEKPELAAGSDGAAVESGELAVAAAASAVATADESVASVPFCG
jgi:hypothetical protein